MKTCTHKRERKKNHKNNADIIASRMHRTGANSTLAMASTDPSSSSSSSDDCPGSRSSNLVTAMKLLAASALFYSAGTSFAETYHQSAANNGRASSSSSHVDLDMTAPTNHVYANAPAASGGRTARRLSDSTISMKNPPSYMKELTEDLKARRKLMEETPPEEVKYWFEYTGPLQVSFLPLIW